MNCIRRWAALLLCLALLFGLTGCAAGSVREFYSLPRPSEGYLQLQKLIDREIAAGCEYAAPTSGSYRQVVHAVDLDGDGDTEAVAFLRDPDGVAKLCIYQLSEGEFSLAGTIRGEGSSTGSFDYADMDGDGRYELFVTWQASTGIGILNVYALPDWSGQVLLTTDCAAFRLADMVGDGDSELLVLHMGGTEGCTVELIDLSPDGTLTQTTARLSAGVTGVDRLRTGELSDGTMALFAESPYPENSTITDIFVAYEKGLVNITADPATGVSDTQRVSGVYAADIDLDRLLEVPASTELPGFTELSEPQLVYDWYSYASGGWRELIVSTYENAADGWYLVLPEGLREVLVVRREDLSSGEHVTVLSRRDPASGGTADLLWIYTLTGDNRQDRAKSGGRFVLSELSSTIYAARLAEDAPYTREEIASCFRIIYSEWNTGSL